MEAWASRGAPVSAEGSHRRRARQPPSGPWRSSGTPGSGAAELGGVASWPGRGARHSDRPALADSLSTILAGARSAQRARNSLKPKGKAVVPKLTESDPFELDEATLYHEPVRPPRGPSSGRNRSAARAYPSRPRPGRVGRFQAIGDVPDPPRQPAGARGETITTADPIADSTRSDPGRAETPKTNESTPARGRAVGS